MYVNDAIIRCILNIEVRGEGSTGPTTPCVTQTQATNPVCLGMVILPGVSLHIEILIRENQILHISLGKPYFCLGHSWKSIFATFLAGDLHGVDLRGAVMQGCPETKDKSLRRVGPLGRFLWGKWSR